MGVTFTSLVAGVIGLQQGYQGVKQLSQATGTPEQVRKEKRAALWKLAASAGSLAICAYELLQKPPKSYTSRDFCAFESSRHYRTMISELSAAESDGYEIKEEIGRQKLLSDENYDEEGVLLPEVEERLCADQKEFLDSLPAKRVGFPPACDPDMLTKVRASLPDGSPIQTLAKAVGITCVNYVPWNDSFHQTYNQSFSFIFKDSSLPKLTMHTITRNIFEIPTEQISGSTSWTVDVCGRFYAAIKYVCNGGEPTSKTLYGVSDLDLRSYRPEEKNDTSCWLFSGMAIKDLDGTKNLFSRLTALKENGEQTVTSLHGSAHVIKLM